MKTYKNLYPRIHSFAHLYWAFCDARRGKRDRTAVASFEFDLERNLWRCEWFNKKPPDHHVQQL